MTTIKTHIMTVGELKQIVNEDAIMHNLDEETSLGGVLGAVSDPSSGWFIAPLTMGKKSMMVKRLLWKTPNAKNTDGTVGRVVEPPQGYVNEYLKTKEGELVTERHFHEWFGGDVSKKPAWDGGKFIQINQKCLTFPYCSQGAIDNPIKLIGENKDGMCEKCYGYVTEIAKQSGKTPEYITKIIRERYL